jgi:phospholipase C
VDVARRYRARMRACLFAATVVLGCSSASSPADLDSGADAAGLPADDTSVSPLSDATPDAIDVGAEVPLDASPGCPSLVPADPLAASRNACAFHAGDLAATTLGLDEARRKAIPLEHIIVILKENRSFDHVFGGLEKLQPDVDVADATWTNLDAAGKTVTPFHLETTCVGFDPDHQWAAMHTQVDAGKMDGFVKSAASSTGGDGHFVMGHYEEADLPFYYFLASTFSIADRYFPSVRSGTFPNRDYMLMGTSDKVRSTQFSTWPDPALPTIFDRLTAAGVTWGVYGDDHPLEETLNNPAKNWEKLNKWSSVSKLLADFAADTVPSVVFVDGRENIDDEHPTADMQAGEQWTKWIYDAAVASKSWSSTALLFSYDEAGGFADHVAPSDHACLARPEDADFHELGVRVPLIAISPWARRHYVSHAQKEHASITRFIEAVFDLPALTARDANADGLLDMFVFECPPAPVPTAPPAGKKGCGGGASISLDRTSFASGETITVHFDGGPANLKDWIAVYPRIDTPHSGSTLWEYCGNDSHTAPTKGLASGTVTLDARSVNKTTDWPLPPGSSWTAYYLIDDGYTAMASVQFDIKP